MDGFTAGIVGSYIALVAILPYDGNKMASDTKAVCMAINAILGVLAGISSIRHRRPDVLVAGAIGAFIGTILLRLLMFNVFITSTVLLIIVRIILIVPPIIIMARIAYRYKDNVSFTLKAFKVSFYMIFSASRGYKVAQWYSVCLLHPKFMVKLTINSTSINII
jgi:hypothetical protein